MARETSLLIRLHSLGDVVLTQPAAAFAARSGPVFVLTRPAYGPLVERFGQGVKVLGCDRREGIRCIRERVRHLSPGRIIDLQKNLTTFLGTFPRRTQGIRLDRTARRRILNGGAGSLPDRARMCLEAAGGSGPALPVLERREQPCDELSVGIVCGGRWELKAIPDGVVVEVGRLLCDISGAKVVLLSAPEDRQRALGVQSGIDRRGVSVFEGGVRELISAVERLHLVVAPDSGTAHVASALGVRLVVVFTSTSPRLGFWSEGRASFAGPEAPCSPCHRHGGGRCRKGTLECRELLVPRQIFGLVEKELPTR